MGEEESFGNIGARACGEGYGGGRGAEEGQGEDEGAREGGAGGGVMGWVDGEEGEGKGGHRLALKIE